MSSFFGAILAGLAWMGLTAQTRWGGFAFGALLGLVIGRVEAGRALRPFRPLRALRLLGIGLRVFAVFLWELWVANLDQLRVVLAPRIEIRPAWIRYRCELETPAMRALLGAMISLTPGSLTYEESEDEDGAWIIGLHILDLRDEAEIVERLRTRFEAPLRAMETS